MAISLSLPNVLADNDKDNNLSKYISVTYGESGGNYICSSDTNTQISNTNELNIGYHTITCTATGNNGTTASAVDNIIIARSDIIKSTANELTLTLFSTSNRYYKKTTSDAALGGICTIKDGSTWLGPTFVSDTESGTYYNISGNYTGNVAVASSFEYLGKKWYVSPSGAWYPSNITISQTTLLNVNTLKGVSVYENQTACAKAMIDLSMSYDAVLSTITYDATLTSTTYAGTKTTKCVEEGYLCPSAVAAGCPSSISYSSAYGTACFCNCNSTTCYPTTRGCTKSATVYTCPNGGTLSSDGVTCTDKKYTCPNGGTLNSSNNTCSKTGYNCPNGGTLSGTTCFKY